MILLRWARACGRVLRVLLHLLHGWWLMWRHAGSWSEAELAQQVQRWSAGLLLRMGITVRVEGTPPAAGPVRRQPVRRQPVRGARDVLPPGRVEGRRGGGGPGRPGRAVGRLPPPAAGR